LEFEFTGHSLSEPNADHVGSVAAIKFCDVELRDITEQLSRPESKLAPEVLAFRSQFDSVSPLVELVRQVYG